MTTVIKRQSWRTASPGAWTGRVLSGVFVAFMLGASVYPKLFLPRVSVPSMEQLGWPPKYSILIGVMELVGTLVYSIPRTATLGAIFLTGLLGGAIAAQLRVEAPLFSHILFGLYLGLFMWGGLWLRDSRLRSIVPVRSDGGS